MEVGALTLERVLLSSAELHWRDHQWFSQLLNDVDASRFCDALAQHLCGFLNERGYRLRDVGIVGIPFPGPRNGGLWISNNLTEAFCKGVPLEQEMRAALRRIADENLVPPVRVIFDAQCDAGGELHHPAGRLFLGTRSIATTTATVLNVATGIAAGFVEKGRVLISNEDFRTHVHPSYDGGAGQLGRHLWYHPGKNRWSYRFRPRGATPRVAAPEIRMTEYLSGPALAARLLLRLQRRKLLCCEDASIQARDLVSELKELYPLIAELYASGEPVAAAQIIRGTGRPIASALLEWADSVLRQERSSATASCIRTFAEEVTAEFAGALQAWKSAEGWSSFGRRIVLTGGVGIHFLKSLDASPGLGFATALTSLLGKGCQVERSRLAKSSERECFVFLDQPALDTPPSKSENTDPTLSGA